MIIEKIGDATLYLGDCLEILHNLNSVDAVVTDSHAVVTDGIMGHEKSTGRKPETGNRSADGVDEARARNTEALFAGGVVAAEPSQSLRDNSGGPTEGNAETRDRIKGQGQSREAERALHSRHGEYALSEDGQQKEMQQMRGNRSTANSSQERQSSGQRNIESGGALLTMPQSPSQTGMVGQKTWVLITDPPYGIAWTRGQNNQRGSNSHEGIKNDGDTEARDRVLAMFGDAPAIVFGSFYAPYPENIKQVAVWHKPPDSGLVGSVTGLRRDVEPIFLTGNWPQKKVTRSSVFHVARGQSATTTETGHPHTKPLLLMEMLIRLTDAQTILDPFMGSGTTGVACANLGRKFIGIEIEPKYFDIACERIEAAHAQGRLFE